MGWQLSIGKISNSDEWKKIMRKSLNNSPPATDAPMHQMRIVILIVVALLSLNGCATIDTVSSFTIESPKIYSGTRLDKVAMNKEHIRLRVYKEKFNVVPPENPETDIFFSFLLDTIILPVTVPIAFYETLFQ
jgi:uncharacterized protein YceK